MQKNLLDKATPSLDEKGNIRRFSSGDREIIYESSAYIRLVAYSQAKRECSEKGVVDVTLQKIDSDVLRDAIKSYYYSIAELDLNEIHPDSKLHPPNRTETEKSFAIINQKKIKISDIEKFKFEDQDWFLKHKGLRYSHGGLKLVFNQAGFITYQKKQFCKLAYRFIKSLTTNPLGNNIKDKNRTIKINKHLIKSADTIKINNDNSKENHEKNERETRYFPPVTFLRLQVDNFQLQYYEVFINTRLRSLVDSAWWDYSSETNQELFKSLSNYLHHELRVW